MALPKVNEEVIRASIRNILRALGEDPDREGLKDTPDRVARLYSDVLDGAFCELPKVTSFKEETYGGIVSVHHFPFYGFCEHHLVPFCGTAAIAYLPDKHTLGLSKLVRIFRYYTKRISIQERLTQQALAAVVKIAEPKGAIVWARAEHMCMTLRGVKSPGSHTTTLAYSGEFETNIALRQQFVEEAGSKL